MIERQPERIDGLPVGAVFTTCLTNRVGVVSSKPTSTGWGQGIGVGLDAPDEEKSVHPGVLVYVGNRRQ